MFVKPRDNAAPEREIQLSDDDKEGFEYRRPSWAPDSEALVAFRIEAGERKEVHLIESSPNDGGWAKLKGRPYSLPGDRFTTYEPNLFDLATRKQIKPNLNPWNMNGCGPASIGIATEGVLLTSRWIGDISVSV